MEWSGRVAVGAYAKSPITVVGAGLAGCEAAVQLARCGLAVDLLEMKPAAYSPAHLLPGPAELVCSNSLKSDSPDSAHGLLKHELRRLGSVIMEAAERTRVPAGQALAVDRVEFSRLVEEILKSHPRITFRQGVEVSTIPPGEVILATGPLTADSLARALQGSMEGVEDLYFFDALAPIVDAKSVDEKKVFRASRWGKGGGDDYLNCPLTEREYLKFLSALRSAPRAPMRDFEQERYFEGCLPIEVLADRGERTLAFGPMRPVGLAVGGEMPFAVVQLRSENREQTAYNLVGFQTKLTQAGQREVFRLIPGLEQVVFLRYGAIHRNMYVNAPEVLNDLFQLRAEPRVRLAGQIVGVEGYVESAAMGLLVGRLVARQQAGLPVELPPPETALGALYAHVRGRSGKKPFEPMNIHFGLLPDTGLRGRQPRRREVLRRAGEALEGWLERMREQARPAAG